MKRLQSALVLTLALLVAAVPALATNGDNLIGVGPVARSMGGTGVAAPQDAISAIFANPAAMCFGPYCPGSQADFAGTILDPGVEAKVTMMTPSGPVTLKAESQHKFFMIPAVGISSPLTENLRLGFGAYGVSGLGVDYRDTEVGDIYTKLEIMKFAPNLAYKVNDRLAVGAALQLIYGNLDLGAGSSHNYALGAQAGVLYNMGSVQLGATYISPQKVDHERLADFDGDGSFDDLELESPHNVAVGVAWWPVKSLLLEADGRWLNWSDAEGYRDFGWDDQWVLAVGAQYMVTPALALRAGFNWGEHPVAEHQGFDPSGATTVQGKTVPNVNYEFLRIVGFPAVIESHLTLGMGWEIMPRMILNLEYSRGFEKTITEKSAFGAVELESSLAINTYSFGLSWRF